MVVGCPRKAFPSHLAQNIGTDGGVRIAPSNLIDNEAPIFWGDRVPRLHGSDVTLFDGKKFREGRDPDFVDDVFECHAPSLHQVTKPVKGINTARGDFLSYAA
jgi:hypothetical protein